MWQVAATILLLLDMCCTLVEKVKNHKFYYNEAVIQTVGAWFEEQNNFFKI